MKKHGSRISARGVYSLGFVLLGSGFALFFGVIASVVRQPDWMTQLTAHPVGPGVGCAAAFALGVTGFFVMVAAESRKVAGSGASAFEDEHLGVLSQDFEFPRDDVALNAKDVNR